MDEDEDDMYGPGDVQNELITNGTQQQSSGHGMKNDQHAKKEDEDEDEDEDDDDDDDDEDEDESDSDIEIVTEKRDTVKAEPPSAPRGTGGAAAKIAPTKAESPGPQQRQQGTTTTRNEGNVKTEGAPSRPGSSYPAYAASTIDVDGKPIFEPAGKPLMELDMDADFPEDDKPWRLPGTDLSDYFNYGFDEFTWASYCLKQQNLRNEAKEQKKVIEDMQNFMGMGGPPAVPVNAMPGMPADMPLEMQQMMQQMMATGVDPSQMDFNGFMQMMGPQAGMGGPGPAQQQGPPMQQQHQQQGGFGFGGGGGGGGYGQQGGRGRGQGRRNY